MHCLLTILVVIVVRLHGQENRQSSGTPRNQTSQPVDEFRHMNERRLQDVARAGSFLRLEAHCLIVDDGHLLVDLFHHQSFHNATAHLAKELAGVLLVLRHHHVAIVVQHKAFDVHRLLRIVGEARPVARIGRALQIGGEDVIMFAYTFSDSISKYAQFG